jgi:hypothetical protein
MSKPEQNDAREPRVSAALVEGLKALGGPRVAVPLRTDEAILAQARQHFTGIGRARRVIAFPRWLAAAAVVALCAWLAHLWLSTPSASSIAREDVNHDGRVDILDAFAVARRLQQGQVNAAQFDINRDGVVDQRDIDLIAAQAVKLAKGAG